ncbi:MAG TPA: hypothetical protein QF753_15065 [Victivallales bacterium]|nr:hypothetical protein [Victivallales bacterium]
MKVKNCIELAGTLLILLLVLYLCLPANSEVKIHNKISDKKKETEVYVDLIKEVHNTPIVVKQNTKPHTNEKKQVNEIVAKNTAITGELPPISANYRKYVGFKKYSKEMSRIGCRFFIIGNRAKNLYELDFNFNDLREVSINRLKSRDYSSKSRVITDEPALDIYRILAEKKYNLINSEVILLVPNNIEKYIVSEIVNSGISLKNILSFKGYYQIINSDFILLLTEANYKSGSSDQINIEIIL